ncbi:hypothetical protein MSPP1_003497 [Malassezia sp. CBS 17886]|nr:hypothetical protein MSPP1_003497 [Malassezia sp. CBS 17886]
MPKTVTKQVDQAVGRGRPAQYGQASRKGKHAWRKNIDLSATEAALEDLREQERTVGQAAHQLGDGALFVEDRTGQETQLARQAREKRPLKSREILGMRSAVPSVQSRARAAFSLDTTSPSGKARAAGLPEKMKRRLRILASRPHEGEPGSSEVGSAGKLQSDAALAEKHDLWAPAPAARREWTDTTGTTSVQPPKPRARTPHAAETLMPAVPRPHPGTSYNPDFDAHEAMLQSAYEKAQAAENSEQEKRALKETWGGVVQRAVAPESASEYMGMSVGSDGDREDEEEVEEAVLEAAPSTRKLPARKSDAQRRREVRAKEQTLQAHMRRQQRMQRAAVSEMPKMAKVIRQRATERAALLEARRQQKLARRTHGGLAGERTGKYPVPEPSVDVQTGDELSESLRQLKPEGNLFWDRFQNLQARGLAETRKPVAPRRKNKLRQYDRHTFKND